MPCELTVWQTEHMTPAFEGQYEKWCRAVERRLGAHFRFPDEPEDLAADDNPATPQPNSHNRPARFGNLDSLGEFMARRKMLNTFKFPRHVTNDIVADETGSMTPHQVRLVSQRVRAALTALAALAALAVLTAPSSPLPAPSPPSPP